MGMKRTTGLLLAASLAVSGCAQLVPVETSALYTVAERDAFYSMLTKGVGQTAAGLSILYVVSQIADQPIPEDVVREKWVPQGVRAYVEHRYVDTRDDRQRWRFTGTVIYEAVFSKTNTKRLFRPVADLAYFCRLSNGNLRMTIANTTPFIRPHQLRPVDEKYAYNVYPAVDLFRAADAAFALQEAQENGAWGSFVCEREYDKSMMWWASLTPAERVEKIPGSSFAMDILISVQKTPFMAVPVASVQSIEETRERVLRKLMDSRDYEAREAVEDVTIEAWTKSRSKDRWGCKEIWSTVTFGDRIIRNNWETVCG